MDEVYIDYERLSRSYFNDANVLKNYIKLLKMQHPGWEKSEDLQIKDRISTLYKIYLELLHVGRYLKRKQVMVGKCKRK